MHDFQMNIDFLMGKKTLFAHKFQFVRLKTWRGHPQVIDRIYQSEITI